MGGGAYSANFNAQGIGGRVETGYHVSLASLTLTPYAAAQAQAFEAPSYAETGSGGGPGFALNYASQSATDTRFELGAWADKTFVAPDGNALKVFGRLAWAPVWRLRCANLAHDDRGLARHNCVAPGRRPLRFASIRLASGSVRVCRLHHRSLVLDPGRRAARLIMTLTEVTSKRGRTTTALPPMPKSRVPARRSIRTIPFLITLGTLALAAILGSAAWGAYMGAPWTRDATVRAYVAAMAPEVAGRIVELHVADNEYVRRGDLLMAIDPTNYTIAVSQAEAAVQQAQASIQNMEAQIAVQPAQINANQAQLDRAQAALVFAQQQAARYQTLAKDGFGSVQNAQQYTSQLHQQEAAAETAVEELNLAERQVASLKAQRMRAEANLAQANAQLRQAQVNLSARAFSLRPTAT